MGKASVAKPVGMRLFKVGANDDSIMICTTAVPLVADVFDYAAF